MLFHVTQPIAARSSTNNIIASTSKTDLHKRCNLGVRIEQAAVVKQETAQLTF